MPNVNASNVTTGKPKVTGAIFNAPIGTAVPTDASSALDPAFVCVGHISEDGVENSQELSTTPIKAWGGNIVYNPISEFADAVKFTMIEAKNPEAMKAYYGEDSVAIDSVTGNITISVGADEMPERVWVIESALRGGAIRRIVLPHGQVKEKEAVTYKDDEPLSYGVTVSAMADDNGKTHYEYIEE
jgi:hypothetical protein